MSHDKQKNGKTPHTKQGGILLLAIRTCVQGFLTFDVYLKISVGAHICIVFQ